MSRLLPAALLIAFLLSACGQSGPLYVPGNPSRISVPTEQTPDNESTEQDEDDTDSSGAK